VIVPEKTLLCGQRLDQEGLGLCIPSALSQDLGQMAHRPARGYLFFSTRGGVQAHGSLELTLRLFE
jgi:sulfite reductase beta subunit-like hemoprotein